MNDDQPQDQGAQPENAEQAADLRALTAAAAGDPQAQPVAGDQGAAQPAQRVDLAQDFAAMISLATSTLGPVFPSLPAIYTPEVTQAAASAAASVCDKHGWMQEGIGGKYGTEIAAAVVLGPLAVATYTGIKADIAARQAQKPREPKALEIGAATAPAADGKNSPHVTVGGQVVATAGG